MWCLGLQGKLGSQPDKLDSNKGELPDVFADILSHVAEPDCAVFQVSLATRYRGSY